jgi:hypothetical protein
MKDTELYQYLLNLKSPWPVSKVEMTVKDQRIDVWAEHPHTSTAVVWSYTHAKHGRTHFRWRDSYFTLSFIFGRVHHSVRPSTEKV